uniref:CSON001312 protein n=1 Tax=Culicoides sonorensis TaxID=179676 RepID=A0A336LLM5_CULSO
MGKMKRKTSLSDVPLSALQEKSLLVLYTLNMEMIILSNEGEYRDWRGVLTHAPVKKVFKDYLRSAKNTDFMESIIAEWKNVRGNNIESLQKILKEIDRYDIYEDTREYFLMDAEAYRTKISKPLFDRTDKGAYIITGLDRKHVSLGLKLIIYDAFLMYSEEDEDFAALIKKTLEEKYGMNICTKDDFLGGIPFEHDVAMTLIGTRCRRLIIVLSKSFMNCPADVFISKYAQHIGIEKSHRKVVPCLKEECEVPSNFKILFQLRYFRDGKLFNFWQKLYEAVAYNQTDKDLNEDEFERIPHKEFYQIKVPKLNPSPQEAEKKQKSNTVCVESYTEKHELPASSGNYSIETVMKLAPLPPSESPQSTTELSMNKKKQERSLLILYTLNIEMALLSDEGEYRDW